MDHIKLTTAVCLKGKYLCISVLKCLIPMLCVGEYLSLSVIIDVCKWILSVSHRLSVYFRRERRFIDDFLLTFRLASPLTDSFFQRTHSLSPLCDNGHCNISRLLCFHLIIQAIFHALSLFNLRWHRPMNYGHCSSPTCFGSLAELNGDWLKATSAKAAHVRHQINQSVYYIPTLSKQI